MRYILKCYVQLGIWDSIFLFLNMFAVSICLQNIKLGDITWKYNQNSADIKADAAYNYT